MNRTLTYSLHDTTNGYTKATISQELWSSDSSYKLTWKLLNIFLLSNSLVNATL